MTYRTLFKSLLALGLVLGFATPALANNNLPTEGAEEGDVAVDSREAVEAYLGSGMFIVSRSELRKIDADPVPELTAIATDRRAKPLVRERAIKCMSLYRDARVEKTFASLVEKPSRYLDVSIMAYMEAFGEEAFEDVAPYLEHRKANVRVVAAKALGMFGGQQGYDLLVKQKETEGDPNVLSAMERFVR